jgi:hypothetical protein
MYNCTGSDHVDDPNGSTKLHMDLTDAVNVMLWAGQCSDGTPGYALWDIFPASASDIVRQFLQELGFGDVTMGDIIHSQSVYITLALKKILYEKYGVQPYTVHQYPGQAVFIPAGCAHQVCCYRLRPSYAKYANFKPRLLTKRTQSRLPVISFPSRISV